VQKHPQRKLATLRNRSTGRTWDSDLMLQPAHIRKPHV
jgi:hypothetical protein